MAKRIQFIKNQVRFRFSDSKKISAWIIRTAKREGYSVSSLSYIFSNDTFIHNMNKEFLEHDELTDILTFDLSNEKKKIVGEIYISIDRVKENAKKFKVTFNQELRRVIIHGVLHLIGFDDKTSTKAREMRDAEDAALSLY